MSDIQKGVPGIPLQALNAITDENTRLVLQNIVDGWHVRNGNSGKGDNRFVTASEIENMKSGINLAISNAQRAENYPSSDLTPGQIDRIINDLQASVMESRLWKELGERIQLIDLSIFEEQEARIAAVNNQAEALAKEAATRLGFDDEQGSKIATLQTTTDTQTEDILGLTTRVDDAENTIISIKQTNDTQSQLLTSLTSRVGNSESYINVLFTTTANQSQTLNSLNSRTSAAESSISTLNTTTANQANSLSVISTKVGANESAITNEITTRVNADNTINNNLNSQIANVNGNIGAIQNSLTTTSNNVSSLSQSLSTLQTTVGTNATAIAIEQTARINADNTINTKYSVKIDTNGYVSGFGLISDANNAAPRSDFTVRADRFSIGSPSGPSISPAIPFTVKTTSETMTDGTVIAPGVYIDYAMIKRLDGAFISAGLLQASKIYTGSQYVDFSSKAQIPAVASTSWKTTIYNTNVNDNRYIGPITDSSLRFYGSYWHNNSVLAYYNRRVRSSVQNSREVTFVVTALCTTDHYLSLWYRVNGNAWVMIAKTVEPQNSYGLSGVSCNVSLYLPDDAIVDFGIFPTDGVGNWSYWGSPADTTKLQMIDLTFNVMAINL